jgi:hypothetical protein
MHNELWHPSIRLQSWREEDRNLQVDVSVTTRHKESNLPKERESMKKKLNTILMAGVVSLSVLLFACGAGNVSPSSGQVQQVKGVAASGSPIVCTVTLKDASVPARVRTTMSAIDGSFSFNVTGLTPPFILAATWTDISGANIMYSFAEGLGTSNINPFSNVAFAAAAEVDPSTLPADLDPVLIRDMTSRHQSVIHQLMQKLSSLFALYGTTQNPVDDEYEADHTRLDAMFDDIKFSVSNGMITVKNKQTGAIIFTAPVNNIDAGIFYPENMPGQVNGASLYTTYCSSCHGPLATSTKQGVTASQILSAIQHVDAMGSLRLSACQIQAIASVLSSTVTSTLTPTTVPVACTYTYDVWGACQSNNTQTRNVMTTTPTGCTGTPVVSQSCTYVPPTPAACTYTYDVWGACQLNNTQTRTVLTTTPSGCTGTPVTSQACTYIPPTPAACTYTYDIWGTCQSNNTQTRNVLTTAPAGCTGTPVTSQACTYTPLSCTYTYSAWGACQSNSTQTRNLLTSSPAGCSGTPLLSQSCTYTPSSTVTLAQVTSSCTGCHGLTVNTTMLKSGGYTVTGRTAATWLTTVNSMVGKGASLASGTAAQDYANFLATLP